MTHEELHRRAMEFWRQDRGCTCGGVDIGVGVMHEPGCGLPSPDDLAGWAMQIQDGARAEGYYDGARACLLAVNSEWNSLDDDPSHSIPPGYDTAAMQAGAGVALTAISYVLAAAERAVRREAGAEEPKP